VRLPSVSSRAAVGLFQGAAALLGLEAGGQLAAAVPECQAVHGAGPAVARIPDAGQAARSNDGREIPCPLPGEPYLGQSTSAAAAVNPGSQQASHSRGMLPVKRASG
jgi:hypothetical protein